MLARLGAVMSKVRTDKSVALLQRANVLPSFSLGMGITWKITGTFLGTILLFGFLALVIVYQFVGHMMRDEIERRASAIGTTLSEVVAGFVATKDTLALHAIVTKYSFLDGVAYVFVQDRSGKVLSQSLEPFPVELRSSLISDPESQPQSRLLVLRGRSVYTTIMPILGGQLGAVHVGFWNDTVEQEIRRALAQIVGLLAAVLVLAISMSIILSQNIVKPILRLTAVADSMSKGDLDTPVGISSRDEIGNLAKSLERMRTSLKAAVIRLRQA